MFFTNDRCFTNKKKKTIFSLASVTQINRNYWDNITLTTQYFHGFNYQM